MDEDKVRKQAQELLAKLMQLDHLATSQMQRLDFKEAREYLHRAAETGSETKLQLGLYYFAVVSRHVHEVQEGKRKGAERAKRREERNR